MNRVKLGELLHIKHGYAFKSENYVERSKYALVTLANISSSNNFQYNPAKTTYYGAAFPDDFKLYTDDLIMPLTEQVVGLFGNSAFVPDIEGVQFVLNQRVGKVIPIEEKADKYYLHYLLSTDSVREQLEHRASGTRQRNISPNDVYDVTVFVPDLQTQKAIGKTLYDLEMKINCNNHINDNLSLQIKAIFDYWFNQFDFPNPEYKPYRSSSGKMIWNKELCKEIPETWKVVPIKNVASLLSGYSFSSNIYEDSGIYRLLTIKNVQDDGINMQVDNFINDVPNNVPDYCRLKVNDILLSLTGNVGRIGIVYKTDCLLNQRVALIKPVDNRIWPFIYALFKSDYIRKKMKTIANGSSQKNLSPIETENIFFAYDKETVERFSDKVKPLLKLIVENQVEISALTELRNWLLPMLMNGQVTVED